MPRGPQTPTADAAAAGALPGGSPGAGAPDHAADAQPLYRYDSGREYEARGGSQRPVHLMPSGHAQVRAHFNPQADAQYSPTSPQADADGGYHSGHAPDGSKGGKGAPGGKDGKGKGSYARGSSRTRNP